MRLKAHTEIIKNRLVMISGLILLMILVSGGLPGIIPKVYAAVYTGELNCDEHPPREHDILAGPVQLKHNGTINVYFSTAGYCHGSGGPEASAYMIYSHNVFFIREEGLVCLHSVDNPEKIESDYDISPYSLAEGGKVNGWVIEDVHKFHINELTITLTGIRVDKAVVNHPPRPKKLTDTGKAQELIDAGSAQNGIMQYALGVDAHTLPDRWSDTIPTGTDAGTYFVWYRAKGDDNHLDSDPAYIEVTISEEPAAPSSNPPADTTGTDGASDGASPEDSPASPAAPPTAGTAPEREMTKPTVQAFDKEKVRIQMNAGLKARHKGSKLTISWGKVDGADRYQVYGAYCGQKPRLLKTIKNTRITKTEIKELKGKKLNPQKSCKFYIRACWDKKGKTIKTVSSLHIHIAGTENDEITNVKAIKVRKKSITLKPGQTNVIKPRLVLTGKNKKKKSFSKEHGRPFRYASSDKSVATVSSGGKITAGKPGRCTVYVYAINGCSRKIAVNVR